MTTQTNNTRQIRDIIGIEEDVEAIEDLEEDSDYQALQQTITPPKTIIKEAIVIEDTLKATAFSKTKEDNKEDSV